jgi:hypothetical protein
LKNCSGSVTMLGRGVCSVGTGSKPVSESILANTTPSGTWNTRTDLSASSRCINPIVAKAGGLQIDPLLCPKCQRPMKVLCFIEDDALIKKI